MTDDGVVTHADLPGLFAAAGREMRTLRAGELGATTTRTGTVLAVDSEAGHADIQLDGDDAEDAAACQIIGLDPDPGARVLVLFSPPSGAYAIGTAGSGAPGTNIGNGGSVEGAIQYDAETVIW